MAALVRHRQTKGSATDRLRLNHRATPRLHKVPPSTHMDSSRVTEICRSSESCSHKDHQRRKYRKCCCFRNLSAQTITDSGSLTPPHSAAEARSSPRTSTRRTQPLLFCAALSQYLPAPQSAIAVRPPR